MRASSFRRLRGPTFVAVICDEAAFWFSDELAANTDSEIVNAVRPGLATTGGPLIIASSPYAKAGLVWELHRQHYGPTGDPLVLVAQGASRDLNPSLSEAVVTRALARDEAAARAEYLGQFRERGGGNRRRRDAAAAGRPASWAQPAAAPALGSWQRMALKRSSIVSRRLILRSYSSQRRACRSNALDFAARV